MNCHRASSNVRWLEYRSIMYSMDHFRSDLIELLHLELRSNYRQNEIDQLNLLAGRIRHKLRDCDFESALTLEIWESLSGFELGKNGPDYRANVVETALSKIEALETQP